jgi:2-haloacid dehalogenase
MKATRRDLLALAGTTLSFAEAFGGNAKGEARPGKAKAICFDALTIFDPRAIDRALEDLFPGKGQQLATAWRTRQFEYCWLRTLTKTYVDFWQITGEALTFILEANKLDLPAEARDRLMRLYLALPLWPDAAAALRTMRAAGLRLAYLSNLSGNMLRRNSEGAGIADLFEHMLSTDSVRAYKPDPSAYAMGEKTFALPRENIVFAAFGGWDAAGARSFGLRTFWVNRFKLPVEKLGVTPDAVGTTLTELADYVMA